MKLAVNNAPHSDEFWMNKALKLAHVAAKQGEVPVGAIIVLDNQIVASAYNKKEQWKTSLGHAELIAIQRASKALNKWRLLNTTLYVTLEPCIMCSGAIVQARVQRLVFAATDPKGGGSRSLYQIPQDRRLNHRPEVTHGVLGEECSQMLSDFFKQRRNL